MLTLATTCAAAKRKTTEPLPAVERYLAKRIDSIATLAQQKGVPFYILSGKYGLIAGNAPIDHYDKKLVSSEIVEMTNKVYLQLKEHGIAQLHFYGTSTTLDAGMEPYVAVIKKACAMASVSLQLHLTFGADSPVEKTSG